MVGERQRDEDAIGVWDVHAAQTLGIPFVGVGQGARAQRLRAAGASVVVADFTHIEATVAALEGAARPLSAVPIAPIG
jgi:phosphoglycolate phosphatase-like HAD superfamily hydrolase